ncbi:MAG TPA: DUF6328 family protein [Caulobacteraceae bacterium]|nr:DUF6328 family protein [Caulobacteraceae bacterium]
MTGVRDRVTQGLGEIRTVVLGVQILLGFQYEAVFQSGFQRLGPVTRLLEAVGLGLLAVSVIALITAIAFNRLAERGAMTPRQEDLDEAVVALALAPFAVALGLDVFVALNRELGPVPAAAAGTLLAAVALAFWYGGAVLRPKARAASDRKEDTVSLKDRIGTLLTESRIVLPGAQALLGFQLAAYLTDGYGHAPADARLAHTAGLVLLIVAMILLMAPAAFHRLAERGEDTPRVERVCAVLVLAAMAPLGLAISTDLFVVCRLIGAALGPALAAAGCAALAAAVAWYVFPLSARARSRAPEHPRSAPAGRRNEVT